jgi:chromosome segregation ATPase
MECGQKIRYQNKSLADEACRKLIADNRQTGKIGKSWKRLNTYRRRVERLEKHLDRERRQRAYLIGKVVELDRQQAALEKERRECVLAIERMFLGE